jgi:hypothetical protein
VYRPLYDFQTVSTVSFPCNGISLSPDWIAVALLNQTLLGDHMIQA